MTERITRVDEKEAPAVTRIVGQAEIEAAFSGKDIGDFGLTALIDEVREVDGSFAAAPELARSYLRVSGNFVDRLGSLCGQYERFIYRHAQTGQEEVWLEKLEVDRDRRGGVGRAFLERGLTALSGAGIWRVRSNGDGLSGAYALARAGFDFDVKLLAGFGDGVGVAQGDQIHALPRQGDVVHILVERLIAAAVEDGRISEFEAEWIRAYKPRSARVLADFPPLHLSRRLLATARYPQVLEI